MPTNNQPPTLADVINNGIVLNNINPVRIDPIRVDPDDDLNDPDTYAMYERESLIRPWMMQRGLTTNITDDQAQELVSAALSRKDLDGIDLQTLDKTMETIMSAVCLDWDKRGNHIINEIFALEAGARAGYIPPIPGQVIYTAANDVIPTAAAWLRSKASSDELFASIAYTYHPGFQVFAVRSSAVWNTFANAVGLYASTRPGVTPETMQMFNQLTTQHIDTDIALPLRLQNQNSTDGAPDSFARILLERARNSDQIDPDNYAMFDMDASQMLLPEAFVIINVERLAQATPKQVNALFETLDRAMRGAVPIISDKQLNRLDAVERAKAQAQQNMRYTKSKDIGRAKSVRFSKTAPTPKIQTTRIKKAVEHMGKVNRSHNVQMTSKATFTRSNRRQPENPDRAGRTHIANYMPDIHVYVDRSGSISYEQYCSSLMAIASLANKLNVDLYVTMFSTWLSQTHLLKTRGRTQAQIMHDIQRLPNLNGGTEYQVVYDYINQSKTRSKQCSIMITDFEYLPHATWIRHPKHLFYMPCSKLDWHDIIYDAKNFAKAMARFEPNIAARMLL